MASLLDLFDQTDWGTFVFRGDARYVAHPDLTAEKLRFVVMKDGVAAGYASTLDDAAAMIARSSADRVKLTGHDRPAGMAAVKDAAERFRRFGIHP